MGVFSFIQNEIGAAGNAINNAVVQPVSNAFHSVAQAIAPVAARVPQAFHQANTNTGNLIKAEFGAPVSGVLNTVEGLGRGIGRGVQTGINYANNPSAGIGGAFSLAGQQQDQSMPYHDFNLGAGAASQLVPGGIGSKIYGAGKTAGGLVGYGLIPSPTSLVKGAGIVPGLARTALGAANMAGLNAVQTAGTGASAKQVAESAKQGAIFGGITHGVGEFNPVPALKLGEGKVASAIGAVPRVVAGAAAGVGLSKAAGQTNDQAVQAGLFSGAGSIGTSHEQGQALAQATAQHVADVRDQAGIQHAQVTLDAPLPQTMVHDVNGVQVTEPFQPKTYEKVSPEVAKQMLRGGPKVDTGTVPANDYGSKDQGTATIHTDPHTGQIVSWSTDNQALKDNILNATSTRQPGFIDVGTAFRKNTPEANAMQANNPDVPNTPLPENTGTGSNQAPDKFSAHAANSPDLPPEARAEVTQGSHEMRNTAELGARADALVASDPAKAMQLAQEGKSDESTAAAISLIKKFSADGNYEDMAKMVDTHAKNAIEAGRTVQANTLLASLTPEGKVAYAQRQIEKFNEKNPKRQIPNITPEQAKAIKEQQQAVDAMAEGRQKDLAQQKVNEGIAKLLPTSAGDKLFALYRTGLLTGFRTPGKVLLTNATTLATEAAKQIPASGADAITGLFTGERGMQATPKGFIEGGWKGILAGVDNFLHGYNAPGSGGESDLSGHKVNFGDSPQGKVAQAYVDTIGRLHGSLYKPFWGAQHLNSLTDMAFTNAANKGLSGDARNAYVTDFVKQATQEAMNGVDANKYADFTTPKGAAERAGYEADYTTNLNKTWLGNLASGATRTGGNAARAVVPFTQIPAALATKIVDYSPIGPVKEAITQATQNKSFDQRAFSQAVGRGAVGTGIMAAGYALAQAGLMSGAYPTDKKTQDRWQAEGKIADSFKGPDGKWHQLASLGSTGNALAVGAATYTGLQGTAKKPGDIVQAAIGGGAAGASQIANSPYLQSINNISNALKTPGSYGLKTAEGLASSVIPTGIANIATATDPNQRQTTGIGDAITNKIPGLREQNLPTVDTFGNTVPRGNSPLGSLLDPTYASQDRSTPFTNSLDALAATGNDATPAKVDKTISIAGATHGLTPQQQTAAQQSTGSALQTGIQTLMATPEYQSMDNADRQTAIQNLDTAIRARSYINFNNSNALPITNQAAMSPAAKATVGLIGALRSGDNQQAQAILSSVPFANRTAVYDDAAKQVGAPQSGDQALQADIQKALGVAAPATPAAGFGTKISGAKAIGSPKSSGGARAGKVKVGSLKGPKPISIKPITIKNAGGSTKLAKPAGGSSGTGKISLTTFGARKLPSARPHVQRRLRA